MAAWGGLVGWVGVFLGSVSVCAPASMRLLGLAMRDDERSEGGSIMMSASKNLLRALMAALHGARALACFLDMPRSLRSGRLALRSLATVLEVPWLRSVTRVPWLVGVSRGRGCKTWVRSCSQSVGYDGALWFLETRCMTSGCLLAFQVWGANWHSAPLMRGGVGDGSCKPVWGQRPGRRRKRLW